ncbi:Succinate dehydrogenase cytochrome b560 (SDHC) [Blastocystis hominis]|uniref:Succinate dehydrogenase cytochrome b560 (SDHC) n=1 Tax=Blastocystis hominis TaxID=12968 RepID=D8M1J9_BLAHO|nr:Succinate dehydrogenase cytochrome b560 (SDHC) [Blastocystis hominis]CBK21938.2 Succinate dehydrogenase cytochrome b560 (SDHC) [Blastocystis hominis]|eukprot:XP_012895986.1 Succinate dehydrogenase cytochrome b560 (SDHC) [Blastocystis hominis]
MKASPVLFQRPLSYIEEQYARGRMVSPHLSIYKVRWATMSSGCHRLTGLGLWMGFTAAGITACCGVSVPALIEAIKFHPLILYGGKFFLTYALGYHYVCGLRHIYYEYYPDRLTWDHITSSSLLIIWGMFAASLLLTWAKLPALKPKEKKSE